MPLRAVFVAWFVLFRIALLILSALSATAQTAAGLALRFGQGADKDLEVVPYPALHVEVGTAPSLFTKPGPFQAEFSGWISVELRAQHRFTVEGTGAVELFVNGKPLLKANGTNALFAETSAPVRLNKGTNALLVRYTAPENANASFRLLWSSRNSAVPIPIPEAALSHSVDPGIDHAQSVHRGAFLYEQFQCSRCHEPEAPKDPQFDAPSLAGIGSRLNANWLREWVTNPSHARPTRMPKVLHGANTDQESQAVAAFLKTLTSAASAGTPTLKRSEAGAALIKDLHCRACHTLPGEAGTSDRIALNHVVRKFRPGALVDYLENPQAHYNGNPMPNFGLSGGEAESIAAFLLGSTQAEAGQTNPALVSEGREIVQRSGCLNCHALDLPNKFTAPKIAKTEREARGCLQPDHPTAPRFALTPKQRADLGAFVNAEKPSRTQISTAEFSLRAVDYLRCDQCHSENQLPSPVALGGKLKPEWTARFIAGKTEDKPRPWLAARMPSFPAFATNLAAGLAALHGQDSRTAHEGNPVPELVKTGETLIGASGGFSCVACHAVGTSTAQAIVESPGINLAYSGERLLPSFFHRWLMNPIAIDPATKMPAYFDAEGRSQLTEYFDGDARKQIEAMWHYVQSLRPEK